MGTYNSHAGHAKLGSGGAIGAVGILNESEQDRLVNNEFIRLMRAYNQTVYNCTCDSDIALSQSAILTKICRACNENDVDLDISFHLNSGRNDYAGDGSTGGVEVWGVNDDVADVANLICRNVSDALGICNRGFKKTNNLYYLNHTKAKAILIECCFVDDTDDAKRWNPNICASAVAQAIFGNVYVETIPATQEHNIDYAQIKALQDMAVMDDMIKMIEYQKKLDDAFNQRLCYRAHIENIGWQEPLYAVNIIGTVGKHLQLEAIKIDAKFPVLAAAHISNEGWHDYGNITRDTVIGTEGQHKAIECLRFGAPFRFRVHIQDYGWSAWTSADSVSTLGTTGQSLPLEAIQIELDKAA